MPEIHLCVINHGWFGEYLIQSAEMIVGKIENIHSFSLLEQMSLEELIKMVEEKTKEIDGEIIFVTDMFGGTPNNVASYMNQKYNYPIIVGVNLPMLLELVMSRDNTEKDIFEIIDSAVNSSKEAIKKII